MATANGYPTQATEPRRPRGIDPRAPMKNTAPRPATGACSLRLRINGRTYRVRPIHPEGFGVVKAFTLTPAGFEPYTIAETIEGPTCDCGDFTFRRDGTGLPCKHLAAARACGLL